MMKRVLYIDIIRILACLMIILIHAPIPNTGLGSYILSIDSLFATPISFSKNDLVRLLDQLSFGLFFIIFWHLIQRQ